MATNELSAAEARALLLKMGGLTTYSRKHAESARQKLLAIRETDGPRPSGLMTRERLLPFLGQRVVVKMHPNVLARIAEWSPKTAEKWQHGRIATLSDVGEKRAFFDLNKRGPMRDPSWDAGIKLIGSIAPAPYEGGRGR